MTARSGSAILTSTGGIAAAALPSSLPIIAVSSTNLAVGITSGVATTVNFASVPAGALIVVTVYEWTISGATSTGQATVVDSQGNTYSPAVIQGTVAAGAYGCSQYYCFNCNALTLGVDTITVTLNSGGKYGINAAYISGAHGSVVGTATSNSASSLTTADLPNTPLSSVPAVVLAALDTSGGTAGFLDHNSFITLVNTDNGIPLSYLQTASTTPADYNPSWTTAGTYSAVSAAYGLLSGTIQQGAALLAGIGNLTASSAQLQVAASLLAGAGSLSANSAQLQVASALLAGVGSLTASVNKTASATLAGAGGLTAGSVQLMAASALLAGAGSLTVGASKTASALFAGSGGLTATSSLLQAASAALAGAGSLSAYLNAQTRQGAALLAGVGALTVNEIQRLAAAALLAGTGSLSPNEIQLLAAAALLAGVGSLTATASGVTSWQAAALLQGLGGLTASPAQLQVTAALLASTGSLAAGIAAQTRQAAALLAGVGSLSAGADAQARQVAAVLAGLGGLTANPAQLQVAAALLAGTGSLLASTDAQSRQAAALWPGIAGLTASLNARTSAAALLAGTGLLTVSSGGVVQLLQTSARLAGAGSLLATATGGAATATADEYITYLGRRRGRR